MFKLCNCCDPLWNIFLPFRLCYTYNASALFELHGTATQPRHLQHLHDLDLWVCVIVTGFLCMLRRAFPAAMLCILANLIFSFIFILLTIFSIQISIDFLLHSLFSLNIILQYFLFYFIKPPREERKIIVTKREKREKWLKKKNA